MASIVDCNCDSVGWISFSGTSLVYAAYACAGRDACVPGSEVEIPS